MRSRSLSLLAVIPATALLLAGCAGSPAPGETTSAPTAEAATCADTTSGDAVDSVVVSDDLGTAPTVEIPTPVSVDTTERRAIVEGDGDETQPGDTVGVELTVYGGATGEQFSQTAYGEGTAQQITVDDTQYIAGLVRTIECATVGSRIVSVVAAGDAFGDQGSEGGEVAPGDSIVIVADIVSILPTRATGTPVDPTEGFPGVELDDTGAPTITIPDADAPTELQLATLLQGDGDTVAEGDNVTVQYKGVIWRTGEVFDESWANGAPASFNTEQVVDGFKQALVGQQVGSQVIVIIPPALGYGEAGNSQAGIEGTDTLVFVVDILATSTVPAAEGTD
ncbi:FKBP-type peptidyl-prolyl cis-trans isomerase [Labedella endophytica]|jgi:FKBP-type peptidyl-prolyl cis-trans isomerase|uniref:peptidylprolyl isomerase n=1 Tax=Labedella endophytica TaxID=1523160 RepID=A0A3S0X7I4_9MICO|nr:FKBP-type peptidyl-prolyl cis-trans isomerase [Labedella endophytica]RUR01149.1 peptidylprolyl isomerase [Labedella endophytica]